MIDLNDPSAIKQTQGGDAVLTSVDALPDQLKQSFEEAASIQFPEEYRRIRNIVVCGMGGSQWPAYAVRELFKDKLRVPYQIVSDYSLPGYANHETLVVFSSYSGTTEEPKACIEEAKKRGTKIAGIASGGSVIEWLKTQNLPHYQFDPVHNPSGQPRIGFGYAVGSHLRLLYELGVLDEKKEVISSAIQNSPSLLEHFKINVPVKENPAKQLAQALYEKCPYYIVADFLTGVGNAIQNQTNETAKEISSFRVIPELNHHMMEGLKFPELHKKIALFVFFYSHLFPTPIQKRFHITKDVVEQNSIETLWYELRGKTKVEQVFELMGLGSYTSMYLAALYGQDPASIPFVDYFKKRLKEMK